MASHWPCVTDFSILFYCILQPTSISTRGLATPWTYFLHLSLSSVILIDSSTESPVHVLMLSVQTSVVYKAWGKETSTTLTLIVGYGYSLHLAYLPVPMGGSVAEWLACWTQAQKGPGSNRSRDAVG